MAATDIPRDVVGEGGLVSSAPTPGSVLVPMDEGGAAPAPGIPSPAAGQAGSRVWWASMRASLVSARLLWRDFTGESAYDHYVERHRREHPDHEPMGEREFWRERARFDEDNVSTGCC